MILGDGIRRNVAHVDSDERAALRDAILELHKRFFPGTKTDDPPGGVSWWFKQDEIHQATHVHGGPEFLPWHREIVNRFEELIRQVNPLLSLHYWDWTEDPTPLFTAAFMGTANGSAGEPWQANAAPFRAGGFYVPGADPYRGDSAFDAAHNNPADPPRTLARNCGGGSFATAAQDNNVTNAPDFKTMWSRLEDMHNNAHGFIGGTLGDPHVSFRDPFVFLLHSNVDRLVAKWQTDPAHPERLDPATMYSSLSSAELTQLSENVEPWSTGVGSFHNIRPWYAPENQGSPHNYFDISVVTPPCYDTNQSSFQVDTVQNPLDAGTNRFKIIFNDVPEEETTFRAATIRVYTCDILTFRVKPGTQPGAPFEIELDNVSTTQTHPHAFQDIRIWFKYTAGFVGTAPHSDGPVNTTIEVVGTGREFQFELIANTIHRPTVAVQMVLDQSGSMSDPAGTSGLTRLQVLKDAASLFATLIQDNNGLGIIRFDDDAYPPNDPTFPGLAITKITGDPDRNNAVAVISAQAAHGATSIGDGLVMGHTQLTGIPAGAYDNKAMIVLTDGIENRPQSISEAVGAGAVDNRTFAIGLGNEFQVNTAALSAIAGGSGGNLLLSGILTPGTDDFFRVKKFFLQILAAVTNTSIVRDPVGNINVGTRIKVPFQLSEADINCRVILLTDFPVVKLSLETPDGKTVTEANAVQFAVKFGPNGVTKTASFNLPVVFQGAKIPAGLWNAILEIDRQLYQRELTVLADKNQRAAAVLKALGAKYCLSVHSFSNLRMNAVATQSGYDPGSTLTLRVTLTEYSQPVERRAAVAAQVEYPDHSQGTLTLAEIQPGVFQTSLVAAIPGIYRFLVVAKGVTYKGAVFTREQILNAAVFREIHDTPGGGVTKTDICRLLSCFVDRKNLTPAFEEILKTQGINLAGIRKCLDEFCKS